MAASPMPAGIASPQDLAVALRYGPQTEQALRRSSYLTDALRQMNTEGGKDIRSPGELVAKLLASAILSRGANRGQDAVMSALRADQGDETSRMLAGLGDSAPTVAPPAPSGVAAQVAPPQPQAQPEIPPPPPPPAPVGEVSQETTPHAATSIYSPQDRDALTHMLAVEAVGEGPQGMAAAAHVALNRLKNRYGGAKSLSDVIYQPHQFTGMTHGHTPSPEELASAGNVAEQVLSGQVPDPTNGAMAFLNPELTQKLYGHIPAWAQGGNGLRIGRHVFIGGGAPQPTAANVVQGSDGPDAVDQGPSGAAPPAPIPPSAPAQSPAVGTAPAGVSPQAPPAGATSAWPTWKPSHAEVGELSRLLNDPRTHAQGVAKAQEMHWKMTQPEEAQITMINGVPFYIPKDPTSAAHTLPIAVPPSAMSQVQTAEQAHIPAPPGTTFTRDPLGNVHPLSQPATGQMVTSKPGQPYAEHYIPGSQNDPTIPQKPGQGYQATPQGQTIIPGSAADPRAPMNLSAGAEKVQSALQPILNLVTKAHQSAGAVSEGYRLQNGTGDIAMVNGLQHLIDDGVVRGEDVNMQMKSSGITGSLGQVAQYVNSGGLLTPDIRTKVFEASKGLFNSIDQQYKSQVYGHRPTFDAIYGEGGFDKYVLPLEQQQRLGWAAQPPGAPPPPAPAPPQQPHLTPGSREAAMAEAHRRGLKP